MKKFKVLGARELGREIAYCVAEVQANGKEKAIEKFLTDNRFYDVIKDKEI